MYQVGTWLIKNWCVRKKEGRRVSIVGQDIGWLLCNRDRLESLGHHKSEMFIMFQWLARLRCKPAWRVETRYNLCTVNHTDTPIYTWNISKEQPLLRLSWGKLNLPFKHVYIEKVYLHFYVWPKWEETPAVQWSGLVSTQLTNTEDKGYRMIPDFVLSFNNKMFQ